MKIDLSKHLVWLTRGRDWGFRFLSIGPFSPELVQVVYQRVFGENGYGDKELAGTITCGEHIYHFVAYRFNDRCQSWKDAAGRSIPHEMIVVNDESGIQCSSDELMECVRPFYAKQYVKNNEDVLKLSDCLFELKTVANSSSLKESGISIKIADKDMAMNPATSKIENERMAAKMRYAKYGLIVGLIIVVIVVVVICKFSFQKNSMAEQVPEPKESAESMSK